MSSDKVKSIRLEQPDHVPVSLGILPSAWLKYGRALERMADRYPLLFANPPRGERDYGSLVTGTYAAGTHVDAWGCVWENAHHGQEAIVTGHPVPTREAVRSLCAPSADVGLPHGFMYLRLADLRGFEELMVDFAEEPPELQMLIDVVLAYNLRQVKLLLERRDPGTAEEPTILYGMCKERGYLVYMHTDGHILEIIPDLIECGVDVINPQYRANGLTELAAACSGKVCVDLDLDRQLFPFCTPGDIRDHILGAVEALGSPAGGLWLKAEVDDGVPLENVEAICCALMEARGYFGHG